MQVQFFATVGMRYDKLKVIRVGNVRLQIAGLSSTYHFVSHLRFYVSSIALRCCRFVVSSPVSM